MTYVRQHGVDQFIQHYRRHATKQRDTLLYGDEIEYGLFKLSSSGASLSLRGDEVRSLLSNREAEERRQDHRTRHAEASVDEWLQ